MANTTIQLKFSTVTAEPPSLNVAEPAYSFVSDQLFVGNSTNHVLVVGGKKFVDQILANTASATPGTLVVRDANGSAAFNVITANTISGNSSAANKLTTARDIGLSGDATGNVSFDGSSNVTLAVELTNTGVSPGTYGSSTNIPVVTVDEDGRVTNLVNVGVTIASTLNVAGDTGTTTVELVTDTLTINGRDGITSIVVGANNTVLLDVDNTVIRTTGDQSVTGNLTINGDLSVIGGNLFSINVSSFIVDDPLIQLAANNEFSDAVDIGFYGHYSDDAGSTKRHAGLFRKASATDKRFILFTNLVDPNLDTSAAAVVNTAAPSFAVANLEVNIVGGSISGLSQAIPVASGGTGANTFTAGGILIGNGTGAFTSLANTGTAGTYANASHVPVITTDAYGRVSGVANTPIAIDASQVSSGTLPIARGGTNATSFDDAGALVIFDGSKLSSLANSSYTLTGGLASGNTITSLTVDDYGRVTAATGAAIAIGADQITSGTLAVNRGGTGAGTFTQNGVLLGQGTSAFTTASSSTEGHLLTINASGVPTFAHLSGGTF
jgi:hypothetical protein